MKRLKQEVEALESEVQEAHQVAEAHDSLSHGIVAKSYSSDDSFADPSLTIGDKVREKLRKKRESESRFLRRFQGARGKLQRPHQHDNEIGTSLRESTSEDNVQETALGRGGMSGPNIRDGTVGANCDYLNGEDSKIETEFDCNFEPYDFSKSDINEKLKKKFPEKSILKCCTHCEQPHQSRDDASQSIESGRLDNEDCVRSSPCNVSFGTVQIRVHLPTLGDHPAVTFGPALSLDWQYKEMPAVDLDDYESRRAPRASSSKELFLSSIIRRHVLLERGFTERDMERASELADAVKNQRAQSYSDSESMQ